MDTAREAPFDFGPLLREGAVLAPVHRTTRGALFQDDCLRVLTVLRDGVADLVFADPPFNLGKDYGARCRDARGEEEYLAWCRQWLGECVRILKPGGSLFVYHLPRWNILLGAHLHALGLSFRHWIAIDIKFGLPIAGRLYPSHYSLLYYSRGKPATFGRIRTPVQTCRHCGGEIKDYGGHRRSLHPRGLNLTDVWTDIPPVRHRKFKSALRPANQLSTRILERVVHLASRPGDLVVDPFGGGGTTYAVCELTGRRWLGMEIQDCAAIVTRLAAPQLGRHRNEDRLEG